MNILDVAKKVLLIEADDIIYASKGRIVITGMGKSGLVGKKIAATLSSTGTPSFFMHPAEASHGDLGMVTAEDVIIAISNSGETDEIVALIPFLKRFSVSLIALTGNPTSTLARASDVNLDISVREEACTLGIVPTASTTATLAMGDAIAVALLTKRGFGEEDFAFFHPSGSLGKKLFVRVADLMHSGDSLPVTSPDASLTEAVMEISSKRLGTTVITAKDRKILGVITDGDVRRGIEKWGKAFFDMHAREVMTKNPKTVSEQELAAKVLGTMEQHSITSLVVIDAENRVVGVIHLHDILKKGIV
jgi:arabinose-5-phosphate isomerase